MATAEATPTVAVDDQWIEKIAALSPKSARALAGALFALATHGDCPDWVQKAARNVLNDSVKAG